MQRPGDEIFDLKKLDESREARAAAEEAFKRQRPEVEDMTPGRTPEGLGFWSLVLWEGGILRTRRIVLPDNTRLWSPEGLAFLASELREEEDTVEPKKQDETPVQAPHPAIMDDIRAAMRMIAKVSSYRSAIDELMLLSGYVPSREEMESAPSDVDAFVRWFKENDPIAARDEARKECADWKRSYENQDAEKELQRVRKALGIENEEGPLEAWAEQFLRERDEFEEAKLIPGHLEPLTIEKYILALRAGRSVRVEGDTAQAVLVRLDAAGQLWTRSESARVLVSQDESETRPGPWTLSSTLPLGRHRFTIDLKEEISLEDAMKLLESKNVSHAPRYEHSVAYRNYRGRRGYLMTGTDGFPAVYVFSDAASGLEPLGFRPIVFEDLKARWVLTDPESEQERPVSAMVKEGLLKRSLASYSGE